MKKDGKIIKIIFILLFIILFIGFLKNLTSSGPSVTVPDVTDDINNISLSDSRLIF